MKTEKDCFHTTFLFLQICHLSVYASSVLSLAPTPPSFLPVGIQSTPRSEREKEIHFFQAHQNGRDRKLEAKRASERGSTAHCPVLEKATEQRKNSFRSTKQLRKIFSIRPTNKYRAGRRQEAVPAILIGCN